MTETGVSDDTWVRRFHADPPADATRLVCFPHAGGSASFFFPVSAALRGRFDVLAVQYPGRQDRRHEKPVSSIPVLADHVFAALRPRLDDRPVAFFGHSMGAVVAYEVARRLEEAGRSADGLIVSGRRAPSRRRAGTVHRRDDEGIMDELRRLGGTEASLLADEDVARMILPAVRGDYRAIETYTHEPGPPLRCAITAFVGEEDPQVTIDEARAWAGHTAGGFELVTFPGGHFYLTARPEETIARIAEVLAPL